MYNLYFYFFIIPRIKNVHINTRIIIIIFLMRLLRATGIPIFRSAGILIFIPPLSIYYHFQLCTVSYSFSERPVYNDIM